ncbi:unnamed protein product [Chrysodeixis includens]|uniref:FLYWCH-type domain-containing protein n=1 Tax=Chrysodeixis includens TaxID=689277 RepID=A0A9P0FQ74_CHRIL|nr:unnamed protein product [Chrysodeixis includens]
MIPSRYGKHLLMVNEYTFSQYHPSYWYCTKKKRGCRARARTNPDGSLKFLQEEHNHTPPHYLVTVFMASLLQARFCTRESTNIFIGGHKFFRHSRSLVGNRIRWTCAKKHKHKCKASAVTIDGRIIKLGRGVILFVSGHLYSNRRRLIRLGLWRWSCVRYDVGCKAAVFTSDDLVASEYYLRHRHARPKVLRASNGDQVIVTAKGNYLTLEV